MKLAQHFINLKIMIVPVALSIVLLFFFKNNKMFCIFNIKKSKINKCCANFTFQHDKTSSKVESDARKTCKNFIPARHLFIFDFF